MADPVPSRPPRSRDRPLSRVSFAADISTTIPSASGVHDAHSFTDDNTRSKSSIGSTVESDGPWARQYVLCFDGGGIRGLSSLLILRELMSRIAKIEKSQTPSAKSSADSPYLNFLEDDETYDNGDPIPTVFRPSTVPTPSSPREMLLSPARYFTMPAPPPPRFHYKSTTPEYTSLKSSLPSTFFPCHYFDYFAGTSTGGLIAIMLGRLRMDIDECITHYLHMCAVVFGEPRRISPLRLASPLMRRTIKSPKYNARKLEDIVKRIVESGIARSSDPFPEKGQFKSSKDKSKTIVVAFKKISNDAINAPYLFRSYDHLRTSGATNPLERNPGAAPDLAIWDIARATSASPAYFKSIKMNKEKFIDGGFGANNPSWLAFNEVKQMHPDSHNPVDLFISIGTGTDRSSTGRNASPVPFAEVVPTTAPQSDKIHQSILSMLGEDIYHRFDVSGGLESVKLDEWWDLTKKGHSKLEHIFTVTESYLLSPGVGDQLQQCAERLVINRRERAKTSRWEAYAIGVAYQCPEDNCTQPEFVYHRRDKLMSHLQREHGRPPPGPDNYKQLEILLDKGRVRVK